MSSDRVSAVREQLFDAALGLDGDTMRVVVLDCLDTHGVDVVVADVVVPVLRHIGELWQQGRLSVMHEHHASGVLRSLAGELRRGLPREGRRTIVLTCPPGELHDLPSHLFSAMLVDRDFASVVLGASTPWRSTLTATRAVGADAVLVSGTRPRSLRTKSSFLAQMAQSVPLFVAGPAATDLAIPGVTGLPPDWREAADLVDARVDVPVAIPEGEGVAAPAV